MGRVGGKVEINQFFWHQKFTLRNCSQDIKDKAQVERNRKQSEQHLKEIAMLASEHENTIHICDVFCFVFSVTIQCNTRFVCGNRTISKTF